LQFARILQSIAPRHKLLALNEKHLLKIAFCGMITEAILKRPKQLYCAPDAASFFPGQDMDWVYDATEVCQSVFRGFIQCPKSYIEN
jgi:asparagine synthase (glutamine-hydrolysing)